MVMEHPKVASTWWHIRCFLLFVASSNQQRKRQPQLNTHRDHILLHHQHVATLQDKPSEMCRLLESIMVSIGRPNSLWEYAIDEKKGKMLLLAREDIRESRACSTCLHTSFSKFRKYAEVVLNAVKRKHRWVQRRARLLDAMG